MDRDKFEELFMRYLADGFDVVDIELTDDRVIGFDVRKQHYVMEQSYFWFGGNGLSATIDYRVIKGLAI